MVGVVALKSKGCISPWCGMLHIKDGLQDIDTICKDLSPSKDLKDKQDSLQIHHQNSVFPFCPKLDSEWIYTCITVTASGQVVRYQLEQGNGFWAVLSF